MSKKDNALFWDTARQYLDHHLKVIRQVSGHTIDSYRDCLNSFINYLEEVEHTSRKKISFNSFGKETLKRYQAWMVTERGLAPKTCNLRMTAIRAFLEYAAQEYLWIMPIYTDACGIAGVKAANHAIEYFEPGEMTALLAAPSGNSKTDCRNQMILIFLYDTAARVAETRQVKVSDIHLEAEVPYVTLLGKGRKYRNIPLLEKTILHVKRYLKEFHASGPKSDTPLFYSKVHGEIHGLSSDTFEKMIKRYADKCRTDGYSMPDNVHCHMIRKTRAMDLYREGVPLAHIQQLLGHENISTTSGFYAFATLDVLAKAMETVNPDEGVKSWSDPDTLERLYRL
ncbi:MAG: site-specific integrase [Clostridiales bacterium]|nr:site-specific integrase [Clostridiales bacterium]